MGVGLGLAKALQQGVGLLVPALLLPALVVACGLALYVANPRPLQTAQHLVFDQFQRWQPRAAAADPVRIIDIDDESLRRLGQWPWPRTRLAELTDRLQKAGVSAIGFDLVLSEPDRTSPAAMAAVWNPPAPLRQLLGSLPDHDQALVDVLQQGRVVLGFALNRQPQTQAITAHPQARFVALDAPALGFVPAFSGGVLSLPALEAAAAGHGALSFLPDADGVVRRVPLLVRQGDTLLPGFVPEILRVAQGEKNITTRAVAGVGLDSIRIGHVSLETTASAELWVHYALPSPARYLPAWQVLAGTLPLDNLRGKMVLIGTSAQGLLDMRFSALGTVIPGVEIHAQVLDQIAQGAGLNRPGWAPALEALALLAAGLLAGRAALGRSALRAMAATATLLVALCATSWLAFVHGGLLLDPVMPVLTTIVVFVLSSVAQHVQVERRQRWVRHAFSRYVSPNLVDYLVKHPETLRLSGQRQHGSFLFTDLEGYTPTMERLDPGEAVSMLNGYLEGMIAIAFDHEGTLTRIVGDGLAVVFSAPVVQPDHPQRAVQCALAMQAFALEYSRQLKLQQGIDFGRTRMGVHTGEVIVGNFGGSALFDYRALGDPVNTAARLEGANRYLGTSVCISLAVAQACKGIAMRPVGRVMLVGKSVPVMVLEPLALGAQEDVAYQAAYALLEHQGPLALQAFAALASSRPSDALVAMHCARLQAGESGDLIVLKSK